MLIIHGDNPAASRAFFLAAKQSAIQKNLQIIELEGDSVTLADLQSRLGSTNLLGETNCVTIEGFFARRPSNEKKKIQEYLEQAIPDQLIFWDGKDLGVQVKNFPAVCVKKFELPKTIFKFLDSLSLLDLRATLENTSAELVFSLLAGQVRKLIQIQDGVANLPSWQMGKLKLLAGKFSESKLSQMHQELLNIDFRQKTSASSLDLGAALELWVISANTPS